MDKTVFQNLDELGKNSNWKPALEIVKAGLSAIDTQKVIENSVTLNGDTLRIKDFKINLSAYKRIKVIGFGKASSEAAHALEKVLGPKIGAGAVIDIKSAECQYIENLIGSHPRPTEKNVKASNRIVELAENSNEDDLVLVIVSGGGSALLCWPEEECVQGESLYSKFLKVGGTIEELNVVRKHLSMLKGGGLAKILYPAKVVGLVFCDIPGDSIEDVASGPTFKDETTVEDAQKILLKYGFTDFKLNDTPKEDKYFEKVTNISLISNIDALEAMSVRAKELELKPEIVSAEIYDLPQVALEKFEKYLGEKNAVLGGGEVKLVIEGNEGSGGRCVQVALAVLPKLREGDVFVAIASDGIDNSDCAGAIVDANTLKKAKELGLDYEEHLRKFDSYNFLKATGNLIFTGQTGANVSDLMLWIRK